MKNIFSYATKELSQDAFLRWLFENYDCEDNQSLKETSLYVLKTLCHIYDEEIIQVKTYSQWHNIDIFTMVKTNKRTIALFIEDKVFSGEHNQLLRYNGIIENSLLNKNWELNKLGCTEKDIVKVFYKTLWLSKKETNTVKEAGWKLYDIESIICLFENYKNTDCVLLKQYIDHIGKIEKLLHTHEMPLRCEEELKLIKWKAYFEFEILPKLQIDFDKYVCNVSITAYNYTCLCIEKRTKFEESVPYIEFRNRDIEEDGFSVTLLCYGVDYATNKERLEKVDERIKSAPNRLFVPKFRRKDKPRQLGRTTKTNQDIITFLKKCIEDYDYIMKEW